MAELIPLANLKGADSTVPGPPGPNTVPTDDAIASNINTSGTATAVALNAKYETGRALTFAPALNIVTAPAGSDPLFLEAIDGYLYGSISRTLYRATSENGPWTTIHTFATGQAITAIRPAGDGEMLVGRYTDGMWKSSGWASNPATATWSQVLVTNDPVQPFSFNVDPGTGWAALTTYNASADMSTSRYIWLSKDHGNTWTVIFDMAAAWPLVDQTTSHMHTVAFDPIWSATTPRLWAVFHKTDADATSATDPVQVVMYSDNAGVTWTNFSTVGHHPVIAIATEAGMVFDTDSDPTALYVINRTPNPADMVRTLLYRRRTTNSRSMIGWAAKAVHGSRPGVVHVSFRSSVANLPGGVVTTDGYRSAETITLNPATSADTVDFTNFTIYKGRLLGIYYQTASQSLVPQRLTADEPLRGVPPAEDNGLSGGSAGGWSVAAGVGAAAELSSVSVGANAVALREGTAIGTGASAPVNGVAIGSAAVASSDNGTAIGKGSSAVAGTTVGWTAATTDSGTAIGEGSKSVLGEGTAIGSHAEAKVQGVAIGSIAKANGDNSVAIGRGATVAATMTGGIAIGRSASAAHLDVIVFGNGAASTAASQVFLGARHMEHRTAPSPTAPSAGAVRMFLRADTAGKLEWCARFPSGAIQVVTTEVGVKSAFIKVTANRTVVPGDYVTVTDGAAITVTLPDPTTCAGSRYVVKNINANAATVKSAGTSMLLDGAATQSLVQWAKAAYLSDGTQWLTV